MNELILVIIVFVSIALVKCLPAIVLLLGVNKELSDIKKINPDDVWNARSDQEILESYKDSMEWISLSTGCMRSKTTIKIAQRCQRRLDNYVLPQMKKRGL